MTLAAHARGNARRRRTRAWVALVAIVVAVRIVLVACGRIPPIDGFYLNAALQLAHGRAPYEDFTHVAFPFVEWVYAPALALFDAKLAAAAVISGIAVLCTSLLLFRMLALRTGAVAAATAGVLYATCAPVLAFPAFERELWTNLLLAAAFQRALARRRPTDAAAGVTGVTLAFALLAKLTAGIGALALAAEWVLARRSRDAAIAGAVATVAIAAVSLAFFARYEGEFAAQVFAFYAFKGESSSIGMRALALLRTLDPCLALGIFGAGFALACGRWRSARPFVLLFLAWLLHYLFVSPSYWDHNAIDLALPAAALAAFAVREVVHARKKSIPACACVLALLVGVRGLAPDRPAWFPHGFGSGLEPSSLAATAHRLRDASAPDEMIIASSPLLTLLSDRRALVSDFELEPVARGVLLELRRFGIRAAFARRHDGVLLGVAASDRLEAPPGSLFAQRVIGNSMHHVMPRMLDAIARREVAAVHLPAVLPGLAAALARARYGAIGTNLWVRDDP